MDEATVRAALLHYLDASAAGDEDTASEIYAEDAVLEFPQSGERFEGVANFREWRRQYPASRIDYALDRVRGGGDVWVAELRVSYDGGPELRGVDVLEFDGGRVTRETIYVADPWEPPAWRARWRAAPARAADTTG
ncbi:nuclear transport factor 2 family protein [Geodermatophilus sp. SYSU D01105]